MRGYIALLSVLIVSALLLVLVLDGSLEALFARDAVNEEASYRQSIYNAWSCGYFGLNRLSFDAGRFSHEGTTTVMLSSVDVCQIISASTTNTQAEVFVQGHSGNSFVPLYITAVRASSSAPYHIHSWREL